ncbi:hypothetical protein [Ktedonobacter racemifer]|uniref:DinB-like domain-containing protein n=1 Tax=Ktedonobacter racemifer DSM 44963 TaxID=485913 RepID=D6U1Q0_KTERA|nr:hypothetical protein [Ktedonobacter racemifer]EFH82694.1 hypothetical protein Krac_3532 [Ktedonobacter racemifer DSM 44963]
MPTRAEILDTLAASQMQVMAFFQGLSPEDLERPATASDVPGEAPWRAKDHLAHLVKSERNIQQLLCRALAGETRNVLLRLQYLVIGAKVRRFLARRVGFWREG